MLRARRKTVRVIALGGWRLKECKNVRSYSQGRATSIPGWTGNTDCFFIEASLLLPGYELSQIISCVTPGLYVAGALGLEGTP